jgi:hypothetical protein
LSAANATGSAWKLPPERISPLSANTSGLSETAFAFGDEDAGGMAHLVDGTRPSPAAGSARLYGSCTPVAIGVRRAYRAAAQTVRGRSLPRRSDRGGRATAMNARVERRVAAEARVNAHRTRDERRRHRVARRRQRMQASAVDTCVPFSNARPFFGAS